MRIRLGRILQPQRLPTENAKSPPLPEGFFRLRRAGSEAAAARTAADAVTRRHADVDQLVAWVKGSAGILPT
jgi:hypothetical protein